MGSAGALSTDWTSQLSSSGGNSSSGSVWVRPEPEAVGKIGGGSRLWTAGTAMDGVDRKLVNIVEMGS